MKFQRFIFLSGISSFLHLKVQPSLYPEQIQ